MENRFCVNCRFYQSTNGMCARNEEIQRPARFERHPTSSYLKQVMAEGLSLCMSEGKFFEYPQNRKAKAS